MTLIKSCYYVLIRRRFDFNLTDIYWICINRDFNETISELLQCKVFFKQDRKYPHQESITKLCSL